MEMRTDSPLWLNESHPNYTRWRRARELSIERGKLVQSIVRQIFKTEGIKILDLGSGEGGTSKVFSQNNFVVRFDLSIDRLQRQKDSPGFAFEMTEAKLVNGDAIQLPFLENSFDLIIIQDVIEHLNDTQFFYEEIKRILKQNGTIYLSTPNRLSLFNFISDPHFGLPIVSALKRSRIKKYFLRYFRKQDYLRNDIAQLLSLKEIKSLFDNDFKIKLNSKYVLAELLKGNKGIIWSNFHLKLISFVKSIKLDYLLKNVINDKVGIVNQYFTPTFYFLLTRKI